MRKYLCLVAMAFVASCAVPDTDAVIDTTTIPARYAPVSYAALPGWGADDLTGFAQAYERSCDRIMRRPALNPFSADEQFGRIADWQTPCAAFAGVDKNNASMVRAFIEQHYTPYSVSAGAKQDGLFTGYYESALNGSLTRSEKYTVPLHARPDDLVMVNLGEFRDDLKGQRIAGRVRDGNLKPYESRADILSGKLPAGQEKVLVWVDDPIEAFFVQVQGSGVVTLDNGSTMRIGYDGQNGHVYYAIGRELVKRGALPKEGVSMQSIRAWLTANPAEAAEVMNTNKSYVFFRTLDGEGPIGGEGVALTPLRSLAVDHGKFPYGFPVWLETDEPKLNRLMMAQDTGGAIRGAVRGDVFWGYGDHAEKMAGAMKSQGRYWFLIPKNVVPR